MKDSKEKLITFVVPAYNVANYIEECLDSILNQTDKDFNIIIVDDGSTDKKTPKICEYYTNKFSNNIKFISQENKGLGGARNTGFDKVDTKYTMFFDSDDWLDINFIKNFKLELKKINSENIDIIFTLPKIYDCVSKQVSNWYDIDLFNSIILKNKICRPYENKDIYNLEVSMCRRVFKTEFLKKHDFKFDENLKYEDVYPHYYLLNKSKKCALLNITSFYYRINRPNQVTSLQDESRLDIVKAFAKSLDYLLNSDVDNEIIYYALDMLIKFSIWCINKSNIEIRKKLIEKLSDLYKAIPGIIWKRYFKVRKDKREKLFVKAMKYKLLRRTFYDYSTVKIGYKLLMKGLR